VGSFRHPVGPLPGSVYWRRRIVLLGIPLFVIALVAYACTGSSSPSTNASGPGSGRQSAGASPTGIITPAPGQTASGPPGNSYPGGSPTASGGAGTGSTGGAGGSAGGAVGGTSTSSGSAGSGSSGGLGSGSGSGSGGAGSTGQAASGAAAGCSLSLMLSLDRTSSSGPVQYPAGSYPTFKIAAADNGSANCTLDVSGKGMVVSVMPLGTTKPIWTSATCSGAADLRVLGPGDSQSYSVVWKRWETQGTTCPLSALPTVPQGTYTVNVEASGVTSSLVEFILD
jgi:hypothetical protein